ncbi:MAG: aminopeptidase P family protein [Clostridia bacterium]|nr:aminopeptidase P family protein [Clostridia bacterium]
MAKICIPQEEFAARIEKIRYLMKEQGMDAMLIYGDEYRKENLRYVSNFWPIFERGALLIGTEGAPILLCAPEDEEMAKEATVWNDVRVVPDFKCVTVSDDIDYPLANYASFTDLAKELRESGKLEKLGLAGMLDVSAPLLKIITDSFACEVVSADDILFNIRKVKSVNEIACLREAARIAEIGFRAMMEADIIGKSERYAAGIAEGEARKAGAEAVIFTVFGSGERSAKIVGRPEDKIIQDGDMIMCALAIQYEGYVATCEFPYAVGNYSDKTKRVIDVLIKAQNAGIPYLKPGVPMKNFVCAVRNYFREVGLSEYDVYPPLHGIGCAEAESPYPDENTEACFEVGMTFNTDISLFGLEGGSNRIEESFVITENGFESFYPFMREYFTNWIKENP